MLWKRCFSLGLAVCLGSGALAQAQSTPALPSVVQTSAVDAPKPAQPLPLAPGQAAPAPMPTQPAQPAPMTEAAPEAAPADDGGGYGPTPLPAVGILQDAIFGKDNKNPLFHIAGWIDVDYNYRSSGSGENNIAPVMNRFGDELEARQLGLYLWKPLEKDCYSWGFNAIFIAGADAAFLGPTAGGWANTNPRFGAQFTDLNLTFHTPWLTEGGIDWKIGRQTTCLGPMGALSWQRTFNSSDYAWYNLEEGRYTGVSAVWNINKQLSWYNGIEVGGWGVFFDDPSRGVDYLTQINYWLDEEAKKAKVWATVLTGPTGFFSSGNSTTWELGLQWNVSDRFWIILDHQGTYSKAPIFFDPGPGYQERAYDVYSYAGYHLNKCWDLNGRIEWYKDVDGGGYPGGFGIPDNNYFALTAGLNYHPVKWLEFRPEVRWDHADKDAFGPQYDKKNEVTIGGDVMLKF